MSAEPGEGDGAGRPGDCPECLVSAGRSLPRGLQPLRRGAFLVHPKPEAPPVPGWFVVAPARHVERIEALTPAELRGLGPLVAETAAALRAETPCERVYVSVFAEQLPHLHVHVIARPPDLPERERGPGLFLAQGTRDADPERAVARRVLARLAAGAPLGSRRLTAALLSGLVCPGIGQLANGQRAKGTALIALSLLAVAALVLRIAAAALEVLPADPSRLDLPLLFELAARVRERSAGAFTAFYLGLGALWLYAVVDAWRGAERTPRRA